MRVGAVAETVRVRRTRTWSRHEVSRSAPWCRGQIVGLPLNGATRRSSYSWQVVRWRPPSVATRPRPAGGLDRDRRRGGTGNSTLYLVDGGYNNDPQNNTGNPIPFPDALQEFRPRTGVRDARSGLSSRRDGERRHEVRHQ